MLESFRSKAINVGTERPEELEKPFLSTVPTAPPPVAVFCGKYTGAKSSFWRLGKVATKLKIEGDGQNVFS